MMKSDFTSSSSVMKSISWCLERQMIPETDEVKYLYIQLQTMEFYGVWTVFNVFVNFIYKAIINHN